MKNLLEIKVCGINDQISMNTAINNNVDYVGLVFFEKSPRNVTIDKAKLLIKYLSNYNLYLVFLNSKFYRIACVDVHHLVLWEISFELIFGKTKKIPQKINKIIKL